MSRPFKLFRLQQIDSQLDWIRNRILEIDNLLKEDLALQEAIAHAEQSNQALQQARKDLRRAEDEVRQQRLKIEQSESSLYGGKIRNPKELKDLENEVAALKRYLSVLEDRQLEAMLAEEEAIEAQKLSAAALEETRQKFGQRSDELMHERERILRDANRLEDERSATLTSIPADDLALYTQLRKTRRGVAVAKVTDRACSACGSTLNAALLSAAHSPNQINQCEVCGRILYIG
jgi:predicted  nucleic acid-binding Zn-ribbon protein